MIHLSNESPVWMHNLERFSAFKNLLFLQGNIHDSVLYEMRDPQSGDTYHGIPKTLPRFVLDFLRHNRGYPVVGLLDPLESLRFQDELAGDATPAMRQRYRELLQSGAPSLTADATAEARSWDGPEDLLRGIDAIGAVLSQAETPCAFVIHMASRLLSSPERLDELRLRLFTRLHLACSGERNFPTDETSDDSGDWNYSSQKKAPSPNNHLLVLVCDKLNDLPTFLYVDNPWSRSIHLPPPDRKERSKVFDSIFSRLPREGSSGASDELKEDFIDGTEGMTVNEMIGLERLAEVENTAAPEDIRLDFGGVNARRDLGRLLTAFRHGKLADEWLNLESKMQGAETLLRKRVKGQEAAVRAVLDVIKGAKYGIEAGSSGRSHRPRGVLFFAGPTGVGKTELAKAMTEALFGDDRRMIRFDMSEYSSEHADQRLIGAPPGYVGYQEGGQLTKAVREQPYSVLLFDEIDKAHHTIFLKFLQILDDGRITDGHGETVYFSECILVFTSNEGLTARKDEQGNPADDEGTISHEETDFARIRNVFQRRIEYFFKEHMSRPEIYNRFGKNFIVFDFIRESVEREILNALIDQFEKAHHNRCEMQLRVSDDAREQLGEWIRDTDVRSNGGRGIRSLIESALIKPVHRALFDLGEDPDFVTVTGLSKGRGDEEDYPYYATLEND